MAKKSSRWLITATWALALLGVVAAPGTVAAAADQTVAAAAVQVETPAINYCDYDNDHPGVSSVEAWLKKGVSEGANTDCIDVGDIIESCGFVQIPITDRVIGEKTTPPMNYWIEYTEVDTDVTDPQVMPEEGVSFPEGYNGGSVTIQAYIGGPEQDYVAFANEDEWKWPGKEITIQTDCESPAPPVTPTRPDRVDTAAAAKTTGSVVMGAAALVMGAAALVIGRYRRGDAS